MATQLSSLFFKKIIIQLKHAGTIINKSIKFEFCDIKLKTLKVDQRSNDETAEITETLKG